MGTSSLAVVHHQIPGVLINPVVAIEILVLENGVLVEWVLLFIRTPGVGQRPRVLASLENILSQSLKLKGP